MADTIQEIIGAIIISVNIQIQTMETGAIYEGDNLEIMSKFPDKSVDLIYADHLSSNARFSGASSHITS